MNNSETAEDNPTNPPQKHRSVRVAWICFYVANFLWVCIFATFYWTTTPQITDGIKLHTAIAYDDIKTVTQLIENGVSPDEPGRNGYPPLFAAIAEGDMVITKLLLDAGADVNTVEPGRGSNQTALHRALSEDIQFVRLLIEYGANVNSRDRDGSTPLHYATLYDGSAELIDLLVDNGADVNARNNTNVTPLHWVVRHGSYAAAERLLKHGADITVKDAQGLTAVDIAIKGNVTITSVEETVVVDEDMVKLLREYPH